MAKTIIDECGYCLLKIRVNFEKEDQVLSYLDTIDDFLRSLAYNPKDYTCGKHYKCERKHFHYHIILEGDKINQNSKMNNFPYYLNKYIKQNPLKEFPFNINKAYAFKLESLYTDELQPDTDTACSKFLRYPLKEGFPVTERCNQNSDILQGMIATAKEEFRFAQEQILKRKMETERIETKWTTIRDYLNSIEHDNDPEVIWVAIARIMAKDSVPPSFKPITTYTERYLVYRFQEDRMYKIAEKQTKHMKSYVENI